MAPEGQSEWLLRVRSIHGRYRHYIFALTFSNTESLPDDLTNITRITELPPGVSEMTLDVARRVYTGGTYNSQVIDGWYDAELVRMNTLDAFWSVHHSELLLLIDQGFTIPWECSTCRTEYSGTDMLTHVGDHENICICRDCKDAYVVRQEISQISDVMHHYYSYRTRRWDWDAIAERVHVLMRKHDLPMDLDHVIVAILQFDDLVMIPDYSYRKAFEQIHGVSR